MRYKVTNAIESLVTACCHGIIKNTKISFSIKSF